MARRKPELNKNDRDDATSAEFGKRWQSRWTVRRVDLVARDTIKPFIASAVVATWQMRWYGHVAHGISRLYHSVSVSTRYNLYLCH